MREDCVLKISNDKQIKIQVAKSEQERATGLMYRRELPLDQGMLFVFPQEEEHSFWMKNTFIPLDMIFIDQNGFVKTIIKNVPPLTKKARPSEFAVKYVLELNAGQSDKFLIAVGEKIDLAGCVAR